MRETTKYKAEPDLRPVLIELKESIERMLAGRGRGMEPSPRLADALEAAKAALEETK